MFSHSLPASSQPTIVLAALLAPARALWLDVRLTEILVAKPIPLVAALVVAIICVAHSATTRGSPPDGKRVAVAAGRSDTVAAASLGCDHTRRSRSASAISAPYYPRQIRNVLHRDTAECGIRVGRPELRASAIRVSAGFDQPSTIGDANKLLASQRNTECSVGMDGRKCGNLDAE